MNSYRWTVRVGLVGVGFLVTLAGLVAGLVTFKVAVLGVEPDGWALSAIAALPFTVGVVLVATAVSALLETVVRRMGSTKDYRWTVRVGLGGSRFPRYSGCVCRRDPYLQRGHCRCAARGVGADRHDDCASHDRCGVAGDCWDGGGRDRCTVEANGGWCLSSPRACSTLP